MGLFGGGSKKTKTEVKPSKEVDSILRDIASKADKLGQGEEFVQQQIAGLNDTQKSAIQKYLSSTTENQLKDLYGGRVTKGLQQISDVNDQLKSITEGGGALSAKDVNQYSQALTQSPLAATVDSSVGKVGLGSLNTTGGQRRAALTGSQRLQATTDLARTQNANRMAVNNLQSGQSRNLSTLGQMSGIGAGNISAGQFGANMANQAAGNKLYAGGIQQAQQQAQNDMAWQNAMGQQQFGWNQLNNKLNVLNSISPMAGSTTTGTAPGVSAGRQLLGAGVAAAGALASKYFSNPATAARAGGYSGFESLQAQPGYNGTGYQMPGAMSGGGGGFWSNLGQGFGSIFSQH